MLRRCPLHARSMTLLQSMEGGDRTYGEACGSSPNGAIKAADDGFVDVTSADEAVEEDMLDSVCHVEGLS